MAEDRKAAETALAVFERQYGATYAGAVECLTKDRDVLL
jgi:putative transposase